MRSRAEVTPIPNHAGGEQEGFCFAFGGRSAAVGKINLLGTGRSCE